MKKVLVRYLPSSLLILACFCFVAGCADTKKPESTQERQDRALRDPMGYQTDTKKVDVSGGDLGHFDKDAFKKDVNDALNP